MTGKALQTFSFDHLGNWLPAFCARLKETVTPPLYRELATLLSGVWDLVCTRNVLALP